MVKKPTRNMSSSLADTAVLSIFICFGTPS